MDVRLTTILKPLMPFGQVCGSHADSMVRCAQLLEESTQVDFVDINMGCPIDLICNKYAHFLCPGLSLLWHRKSPSADATCMKLGSLTLYK